MTFAPCHSVRDISVSDELWQRFTKMILLSNTKGEETMVLEQMINKRMELMATGEILEKAMTAGVKIRNHGDDTYFRSRVNLYERVLEDYLRSLHEPRENELGAATNLKIDAQIGSKRPASPRKDQKIKKRAKNKLKGINDET